MIFCHLRINYLCKLYLDKFILSRSLNDIYSPIKSRNDLSRQKKGRPIKGKRGGGLGGGVDDDGGGMQINSNGVTKRKRESEMMMMVSRL